MNICVYGASSDDIAPIYVTKTEQLGALLADRGHGLIFGGGAHGLMGAAVRGVCAHGGEIIGVAPHFFKSEGILFDRCTRMIRTDTMRERKEQMEQLADAFIMAPGGIGTFEEFFEILTLKQLGRHGKPIGIFNVGGYYDPLLALLRHAVSEGFLSTACLKLYVISDDPAELLALLEAQPAEEAAAYKPV